MTSVMYRVCSNIVSGRVLGELNDSLLVPFLRRMVLTEFSVAITKRTKRELKENAVFGQVSERFFAVFRAQSYTEIVIFRSFPWPSTRLQRKYLSLVFIFLNITRRSPYRYERRLNGHGGQWPPLIWIREGQCHP